MTTREQTTLTNIGDSNNKKAKSSLVAAVVEVVAIARGHDPNLRGTWQVAERHQVVFAFGGVGVGGGQTSRNH